jgi:transcriptional adapter 2-alpha
LIAPELPLRLQQKSGLSTPPPDQVVTNGVTNGVATPQPTKIKFVTKPLPNSVPMKFGKDHASDLQLLTPEERELCSVLRIMPKPYLAIKENLIREAMKQGGSLKKKVAKEICRIDVNKGGQLFDFFVHSGWIARA